MCMYFFNLYALLLGVVSTVLSFLVYSKIRTNTRFILVANLSQLIVLVLSLGYVLIDLSHYNEAKLPAMLSFIVLSNLYVGLFNLVIRLYTRIVYKQ